MLTWLLSWAEKIPVWDWISADPKAKRVMTWFFVIFLMLGGTGILAGTGLKYSLKYLDQYYTLKERHNLQAQAEKFK